MFLLNIKIVMRNQIGKTEYYFWDLLFLGQTYVTILQELVSR